MQRSSRCFAEPGPGFRLSKLGHSASKTRVNALMVKNGALRCVRGTSPYFFTTL